MHVHGRIDRWQCFACQHRWQRAAAPPQHCPSCQSQDIRVDVVFFGERALAYRSMEQQLMSLGDDDTLVVIGTTGQVVNPLNWVFARPRVIVVDPNPSEVLTRWPGVEWVQAPASQLPDYYPLD
jgi:NAD-dependent deacetylase